jgi:hypothetical protein
MRSLIGTLCICFALTGCTPLSANHSIPGDAGNKPPQKEQEKAAREQHYKIWWESLTPEQRAKEFQRQHERALSP